MIGIFISLWCSSKGFLSVFHPQLCFGGYTWDFLESHGAQCQLVFFKPCICFMFYYSFAIASVCLYDLCNCGFNTAMNFRECYRLPKCKIDIKKHRTIS